MTAFDLLNTDALKFRLNRVEDKIRNEQKQPATPATNTRLDALQYCYREIWIVITKRNEA